MAYAGRLGGQVRHTEVCLGFVALPHVREAATAGRADCDAR